MQTNQRCVLDHLSASWSISACIFAFLLLLSRHVTSAVSSPHVYFFASAHHFCDKSYKSCLLGEQRRAHLCDVEDVDIAGLNGGHGAGQAIHKQDQLVRCQRPAKKETTQASPRIQESACLGCCPTQKHKVLLHACYGISAAAVDVMLFTCPCHRVMCAPHSGSL